MSLDEKKDIKTPVRDFVGEYKAWEESSPKRTKAYDIQNRASKSPGQDSSWGSNQRSQRSYKTPGSTSSKVRNYSYRSKRAFKPGDYDPYSTFAQNVENLDSRDTYSDPASDGDYTRTHIPVSSASAFGRDPEDYLSGYGQAKENRDPTHGQGIRSDERRNRPQIDKDDYHDYEEGYSLVRRREKSGYQKNRYDEEKTDDSENGRSYETNRDPGIMRGLFAVVIVILLIIGVAFGLSALLNTLAQRNQHSLQESQSASRAESEEESQSLIEEESSEAANELEEAALLAAQYDYDAAIALLSSSPAYESSEALQSAVADYESIRSELLVQDINTIPHIFFHILCVDPENAFDTDKWGKISRGYNSYMTTISEFEKILEELYEKGYVLVSIRDLAMEVTDSEGNISMQAGRIYLPAGKKAIVMSEDDVCYYEYMKGAGFADLMVVGQDGRPTTHYIDKDGHESVGDYDLVPILDKFIDEHPDFSYRGHKACLVFTGYNGVLGYRTDESYDPDSEYYDPDLESGHDVEAERTQAIEVLKALYEDGYDLGSHSWGHLDLGQIEYSRFKSDCDRWERNVAPLIEEATGEEPNILIYPKGADIADWHDYSSDNERFNYLYDLGFRYFCNVDNNKYWVQLGESYFRQGRRALDGYNMWLAMTSDTDRMDDLFDDVSAILDAARPTPVPSY